MNFVINFRYSDEVYASNENIKMLNDVYGKNSCFWKEEDGRLAGVVSCKNQQEFINLHDGALRDTVLTLVNDTVANRAIINQFPNNEFINLYKDFSAYFNLTCVTS